MPHRDRGVSRDIVVIAASAGGVEALLTLVGGIRGEVQAALFALLHSLETGSSRLPQILDRRSALPVVPAVDCQAIEPGRIYAAVPGRHLALQPGVVRLLTGPRENGHRPSADVLFRSAASTYGERVLGIVLSGADDDGAAGLNAIKRAGGLAVVQDPREALHARMPESALAAVTVDYCLPVGDIGRLVSELAPSKSPLSREATVTGTIGTNLPTSGARPEEAGYQEGTPTAYTCPECHGTLWEIAGGEAIRFRCRVGHAYTAEHLLAGQSQEVEAAVWMAVRTLEEKAQLSDKLYRRAVEQGMKHAAQRFDRSKREARRAAQQLQELLLNGAAGIFATDAEVLDETLPPTP